MPARLRSLSTRLLVTTTILLLAAFALTIFLLDAIFQRASENAIRDLLEVQVFALIGLAEPDSEDQLRLPAQLPDARLSSLGSGLYAEIVDEQGGRIWRSPSAIGTGYVSTRGACSQTALRHLFWVSVSTGNWSGTSRTGFRSM